MSQTSAQATTQLKMTGTRILFGVNGLVAAFGERGLVAGARGQLELPAARGLRTEPELLGRLRALPGVKRVSLALHRPWAGGEC